LVSFDTLRPLASVGSRVVTIALLLMLLVLWLVNWSMSIIGIRDSLLYSRPAHTVRDAVR
ncbi:hypothetical protein ONQ97_27180, partial [Salmonella enterica subsp. enterica serovar Virginia]|nr:hypothetical protein [Salmonella enterica subsp. enterica serovar Virginia]